MKFSNGCWLQKRGCSFFAPEEVYFVHIETNRVTICAPTNHIYGRGNTLGGINLTIVITSPAKSVLRVQTSHHLGSIQKYPEFDLLQKEEQNLCTKETPETITITSGTLSLVITKNPWSMTYLRDGEVITKSTGKDLALIKTDWHGEYYDQGDHSETYIRQQLSLGVSEYIYGLGERFTPYIKNGQTVECTNADGGTSTEQSYKNIPFFISNKGYGVLVNHPETVSFEIASEMVTRTSFTVAGGYLDYYLFDGPSMKEVLKRYTDLTGKPSLPAPWTFGLWLSTSFTTNYDEQTVMSFIDGMQSRGIPLRTFHFDCFWMKEFHWCDFIWDSEVFPDPIGMLQRIKAKGLNICVWINSYIGQESSLFLEGVKNNYFIKRKNGDVFQWDVWQPGLAIIDFTNPAAYRWYQEKLAILLDMGVDCFKTDFGERIPIEDICYFDGSDPEKMHNYYSYLYNKCVYELLEAKRGKGEAVLFARSATVGGQKFPVHWGGDCWSDYESMEESLRGGLSLMMSGFGFWAHDIGGFEHTSTPDVYKRWVAFGLLSSHSRLHGSQSYRVPWIYDEEAVDVVRFFTKLKARLMPYIFSTAVTTSITGIPTMRAMVLDFSDDRTCHYLDKQYMLGDNLLVAPIFNEQGMAEYYLPKGKWTNFFSGEEVCGGNWIKEYHNYLSIPLMVRENSIVALGACDQKPDYDYAVDCELRIYALLNQQPTEAKIYAADQSVPLFVSAKREDSKICIHTVTDKPYTIRLVNVHANDICGGTYQIDGQDTVIKPLSSEIIVNI